MRQAYYSVPTRYVAATVTIRLGPLRVDVLDTSGHTIASHPRAVLKGSETLLLDHYLDVLAHKPGAFSGATALAQARAAGVFTTTHERYWDAVRTQLGDAAGTTALIKVLMAARSLPTDAVTAAMHDAISTQILTPDAVVMTARAAADAPLAQVIDLPARLHQYDRPTPTLHAYDNLLDQPPTTPA